MLLVFVVCFGGLVFLKIHIFVNDRLAQITAQLSTILVSSKKKWGWGELKSPSGFTSLKIVFVLNVPQTDVAAVGMRYNMHVFVVFFPG